MAYTAEAVEKYRKDNAGTGSCTVADGAVIEWDIDIAQPADSALDAIQADLDTNRPILENIEAKEAEITQRRLREAILGTDGGWLSDKEDEIIALRATLV